MLDDGVSDFIASTSIFVDGRISTHADPTRGQRAGQIGQRTGHARAGPSGQCGPAGRFAQFRASGGAKFTKMGDSLTRTPMKHRAKFDAASFISGGEIRNRTKSHTHTHTHTTNSNRYIHTLLSACVDSNTSVGLL